MMYIYHLKCCTYRGNSFHFSISSDEQQNIVSLISSQRSSLLVVSSSITFVKKKANHLLDQTPKNVLIADVFLILQAAHASFPKRKCSLMTISKVAISDIHERFLNVKYRVKYRLSFETHLAATFLISRWVSSHLVFFTGFRLALSSWKPIALFSRFFERLLSHYC